MNHRFSLKKTWYFLKEYLQGIAGVPNYSRYLQHIRQFHPDQKPLSEKEFHQKATDEKYGGTTIRRCC